MNRRGKEKKLLGWETGDEEGRKKEREGKEREERKKSGVSR